MSTFEAQLGALFKELQEQTEHMFDVADSFAEVETRLDVAQRTVVMIRERIDTLLGDCMSKLPGDVSVDRWRQIYEPVRYVGKRLGDAAVEVLLRESALTSEEVVDRLRAGGFRFRTPNAAREAHAALNGKPEIKRDGDRWSYDLREHEQPPDVEATIMRPVLQAVRESR